MALGRHTQTCTIHNKKLSESPGERLLKVVLHGMPMMAAPLLSLQSLPRYRCRRPRPREVITFASLRSTDDMYSSMSICFFHLCPSLHHLKQDPPPLWWCFLIDSMMPGPSLLNARCPIPKNHDGGVGDRHMDRQTDRHPWEPKSMGL